MAEVVEEAEGQVVEAEEMVRIEVVRVKRVVKDPDQVRGRGRATPGTRRPGMQTCLLLNHASGTGPMANLLIFVLSQQLAPGKIILFLNPITKPEGSTSSARKIKYKS